jgi:ribosome-binding protein aMBF1 (putative translation factor)
MNLQEKLKKISSDEKSDWVKKTQEKLAHAGARKNARKVALRVLDILEQRGMSQTALAAKMGVSRQQVTKIVRGQDNFSFETIDKLERALGVTLMKIVGPPDGGSDSGKRVRGGGRK